MQTRRYAVLKPRESGPSAARFGPGSCGKRSVAPTPGRSAPGTRGKGLEQMIGAGGGPDKMAEVAGLAAAIADRILDQHEAGTSIPPEQFRMLVRAARMLLDNDVPWPPSVEHVVMEVARRLEDFEVPSADGLPALKGEDVVVRLSRALNASKRP